MNERLRAVIDGVVQGAGFRYFVIQRARALGISGFVANRRDGSVEVVAEGQRDVLEDLLRRLREGPRSGIVEDVSVEWNEASGEFDHFDVKY